jgi:hypothetical protein
MGQSDPESEPERLAHSATSIWSCFTDLADGILRTKPRAGSETRSQAHALKRPATPEGEDRPTPD